MKVLLSWLREYVDTGDDLDELSATLAMLGLPVEDVIQTGGVPGVVTARVVRTEAHPDAAKIQRVWVDAGDGRERHVWCGAFNFAVGDVVPLATLGTEMPDGRTISRRGILGIDSEGMLCSARELGLGDDHSGILVLPADLQLGVPYGEALGRRDDVVLDLDVTRNRPDCLSYVGVARDLAAKRGVPFTPPAAPVPVVERRTVAVDDGRDHRRRPLRAVHVDRAVGRGRRAVGAVDGRAPDGGRHAADQQRRRRQQLRDARARPAQPPLRPGDARGPRLPDPPGDGR